MTDKIGNIKIDYSFYSGEDMYSDGQVEDDLLEIVRKGNISQALKYETSWPVLYHLSDIRENLLEWYPFRKNSKILEIGAGCGALTGLLSRKAEYVTCIELSKRRTLINAYRNADCGNVTIYVGNFKDIEPNLTEEFDYITLIGVLEYSSMYLDGLNPYLNMLETAKKHLKDDGKIIVAIENKMGLKYWNGASEDHTGHIGSGLNDYSNGESVRTFSKPEMASLLKRAGIASYKMYYPVPDYKLPESIYSENFQPKAGNIRNYGKDYDKPRLYHFNEAAISDQLCEDQLFSYFSNSFLLITGEEDEGCLFEKYGKCRKKKFQIRTEIYKKDGQQFVRKLPLCQEAREHVLNIKENERKWSGELQNIQSVKGWMENDSYVTPFISGQDLDNVFYEYRHNPQIFIEKFKCYIKNFFIPEEGKLTSFEISPEFIRIFGEDYPEGKQSLKCTNIDLIFSNLKLSENGQLYALDYEWCFDFPIPYEYVIWRSAWNLHEEYRAYLRSRLCKEDFLAAIGISSKTSDIYMKMEKNFGKYIFGQLNDGNYLSRYRKNMVMQDIRFVQ